MNVVVQMEETAFNEIKETMDATIRMEATLKSYADLFLILETAIRSESKLSFNEENTLCINSLPIDVYVNSI